MGRYFTKFYLESYKTRQRLLCWLEFIGDYVPLGRAKCVGYWLVNHAGKTGLYIEDLISNVNL